MGHLRYGKLPATLKWNQVVALLDQGADLSQIALASYDAARSGFEQASRDIGVTAVFSALNDLVGAFSGDRPIETLKKLGFDTSPNPSFIELLGALNSRIDSQDTSTRGRNDAIELAQRAASETLSYLYSQHSSSLFGKGLDDLNDTFREYGSPTKYSTLAREFFSRFTKRYLSYYLSRELANHVGIAGRFRNIEQHKAFDYALELHCRQASKIIEEFASGWFSKTKYEAEINQVTLRKFTYAALKKIGNELSRRGPTDAQA
jgi:hypothetical protein